MLPYEQLRKELKNKIQSAVNPKVKPHIMSTPDEKAQAALDAAFDTVREWTLGDIQITDEVKNFVFDEVCKWFVRLEFEFDAEKLAEYNNSR